MLFVGREQEVDTLAIELDGKHDETGTISCTSMTSSFSVHNHIHSYT